MTPPPANIYRFGPFQITSELPIPELTADAAPADPQTIPVTIALGPTPTALPEGRTYGALCQVTPTQYLLDIPAVARFHVTDGREVRITLYPDAPPADVTGYLLGSVFGALCHQNALLPLHASAIATPAGVAAFLGPSGAGKSTLAAALQQRGHTIVSDDICLLRFPPAPSPPAVIPIAGWLKLWRNSFDHLGHTPDDRNRVFATDDKFRLYLNPAPAEAPRILRHILFLERATPETTGQDPAPRLDPIPPAEAIAHMMRLTYLGYITELTQSHARAFTQCAAVLTHAKPYRLTVPTDLEQLPRTLTLVEQLLALSF